MPVTGFGQRLLGAFLVLPAPAVVPVAVRCPHRSRNQREGRGDGTESPPAR